MTEKPSRRKILGYGIGAAVGAATVYEGYQNAKLEDVHVHPSELFMREVSGFEVLYGDLTRDEVLFIDEQSRPLKIVKLERLGNITPGKFSKKGLLRGGFDGRWLTAQRKSICKGKITPTCDPKHGLPRALTSIPEIHEAIENTTDEVLDPQTYFDIVDYYGKKPTEAHPDFTRMQYVRTNGMYNATLPAALKHELKFLLPGLAAEESHFDNGLVSGSHAKGIFQFLPKTWKGFEHDTKGMVWLSSQVMVAGKYMEHAYKALSRDTKGSLAEIKKTFFDGDEDAFQKYFLAPVLINSFNTGSSRMQAVIDQFAKAFPSRETLEKQIGAHEKGFGYDAFFAMVKEASALQTKDPLLKGYKKASSEYVPRVYALANLIEKREQ